MAKRSFNDGDGVLFKYRFEMIKKMAQALGRPLTSSFLKHFYKTTLSMDDSELIDAFSSPGKNLHHLLNSDSPDSFVTDVKLYTLAREGLKLLKENGFHNYLVTARTEKMRAATMDSLKRHNLLNYIDAVFMRQSKDIPVTVFKGATATALRVTHAFEDTFYNLAAVVSECKTLEKAYLINQPWNAKHEVDELYPVHNVQIERMDSYHTAVLDAVATSK